MSNTNTRASVAAPDGSAERQQQMQQSAGVARAEKRKRPLETGRAAQCGCTGAMSQQGMGTHGNESVPQKLLQLIGYRDPKQRADSWIRPPVHVAARETAKKLTG